MLTVVGVAVDAINDVVEAVDVLRVVEAADVVICAVGVGDDMVAAGLLLKLFLSNSPDCCQHIIVITVYTHKYMQNKLVP